MIQPIVITPNMTINTDHHHHVTITVLPWYGLVVHVAVAQLIVAAKAPRKRIARFYDGHF